MKRLVFAFAVVCALAMATAGVAQDKVPKVAIINIQMAIAQSNDGQEAAKMLRDKFAPKRAELEKQQKDITDLQNQLRTQEKTLSEDARSRLMRTLDEKTRAFNRLNEDATNDFQQAEQDVINEIGRKMLGIVSDYSQKNAYSVVLDVSSPQTPVLYADASIDITQNVIELYNQATAKPAAGTAPKPAAPAASGATAAPAAPSGATAPKP